MEYLNYLQYNSPVILTYFFISLGVMFLDMLTAKESTKLLFSSATSDSLLNPLTYFKLISYIFGHMNWSHFTHNFLYLLLVGPMVEEKYGMMNLIVMIGLTAILGSLYNRLFDRARILGASGVVFMLIVLSSFVNIEAGKVPLTLVLIFLFYILDEIFKGITRKNDGVSHSGHLLGGLCGLIFGFYFL